jgi:hypothetical protein
MKTPVSSDKNVAQLAREFPRLALNFGIEFEA